MKLKNNSVGKTTYWFCENGMRTKVNIILSPVLT